MDANLTLGLNADDSATLCKELNALLCDLHVFHHNARGFHWNVQGPQFFELQRQFTALRADLDHDIEAVAKRIVTLGGTPLHTMQDHAAGATIPAVKDVQDGTEAVRHCAAAYGVLLVRERALHTLAAKAGDEGTRALLSTLVGAHETTSWKLRAYLS